MLQRHALASLLSALLLTLVTAIASAQQNADDWVTLGEPTIADERELVSVGRHEGSFARVRLESIRGEVFVEALRVTFVGGELAEIPVRQQVGPARGSNPLRLTGGQPQMIEKIEILTRPTTSGGRVVLRVLGEQAEEGDATSARAPAPATRPAPAVSGLATLDSRRIDPRGERHVLAIGQGAGRTSAIRVRVEGAGLFVRRLEIIYGGERSQDVRIGETIEAGAETREVELEGDLATAREIVVVTRPTREPLETRLVLLGRIDSGRPPAVAEPRQETYPAPRRDAPRADVEWGRQGDPSLRARLEPSPEVDGRGVPVGLVLLASQRAGFRAGRDVLAVGEQAGAFDKIVLRAEANDVFITELTIVYGNGERDRIVVRDEVQAGAISPAILLKGDRTIQAIEIIHQSRPDRRGPGLIEFYGERAEPAVASPQAPPTPPQAPTAAPQQGWTLIGRQRAQMLSDDADSFEVGRQHGPIRALRLAARRHAVMIFGMRVHYADGSVERLRLGFDLRDGDSSPVIELRRGLAIERIIVLHRSRINFKGDGETELWVLR